MPAESVFLDTAGWLSLLNSGDRLHAFASNLWALFADDARPLVLTDWIIAETGNGVARFPLRRVFPKAVSLLLSSPRTRLVRITDDLREQALNLYATRPDKTWGLVDCASFVVMREHEVNDAFTTDRHFEQAGFNCLLPSI